jgi:hypothetical protein
VDATRMTSRMKTWCGAAAAAVALIGLAVYFALVGLSKANELASVISALVAVAGLGVSVWGIVGARNASAPGGQVVQDSRISGGVHRVGPVAGNARIGVGPRPSGSADAQSPKAALMTAPPTTAFSPGSQSVTGSDVTGGVHEIDSVCGDLDIGGIA